jgi:RNA polymerase sigma-70 factor (ECF subfamily)
LAERLRNGSSAAWRDLVRLYGPLVDRWCRAAHLPPDVTLDIAQEVFLAAFRGIRHYDANRENATFRGWLWTVTRSRIVEYYRRQRGITTALGGSSAQAGLQAIADPVPWDEPTRYCIAHWNRSARSLRARRGICFGAQRCLNTQRI